MARSPVGWRISRFLAFLDVPPSVATASAVFTAAPSHAADVHQGTFVYSLGIGR